MNISLSDAEKVFIIHGVQEGYRNDGRRAAGIYFERLCEMWEQIQVSCDPCGDFRSLYVERGVLGTTNGSSRVRLGDTDVVAAVKCELVECLDSAAETGRLFFSVACSANASPHFSGRGGDEFGEEIADALHLAYDNSHSIANIDKLTLTSTHYWRVNVDVVVLQCGGSTVDAVSVAVSPQMETTGGLHGNSSSAKAALMDTELISVTSRPADENKMSVDLPDSNETWTLQVDYSPIIVTVSKVGSANIVDATLQEDACSFASLWVAVSRKDAGKEYEMTMARQAGGGSLDAASLHDMIQMGVSAGSHVDCLLVKRVHEEERSIAGQTFHAH